MSSEIIEDLINRNQALTIQKTKEPSKDLNSSLTEQIRIKVVNRDLGACRNYKLANNFKFEMFWDFLNSEIKTTTLNYILNSRVNVEKLPTFHSSRL